MAKQTLTLRGHRQKVVNRGNIMLDKQDYQDLLFLVDAAVEVNNESGHAPVHPVAKRVHDLQEKLKAIIVSL